MPWVPTTPTPPLLTSAAALPAQVVGDAAPGAWWLPALSAAERGAASAGSPPAWAAFAEQALGHATAAGHGPGERIREVPGMGPEGRLVHPLWPFLVAADIRFAQAEAEAEAETRAQAGAETGVRAGDVVAGGRGAGSPTACDTAAGRGSDAGTGRAAGGTAADAGAAADSSTAAGSGTGSDSGAAAGSGAGSGSGAGRANAPVGDADTEGAATAPRDATGRCPTAGTRTGSRTGTATRTARDAATTAAEDCADRQAVWAGARRHLAAGLVGLAARTLVGELRMARLTGALQGEDSQRRFDSFVRALAGRPALTSLLCRRYPVLARLLAERCLNAVAAATELLDRLRADRARILAAGLLDADPGRVTDADFGRGDPHAGGRTVAVLVFDSGRRLVYKPRPLGLHARWNELVDWLAGHRPELAVRTVRVLPRGGYGWAEYVDARPCASAAAIAVFYERLGAQLALLYAVDGVDIHAENLIAAADHPVVIDVETLFHPYWLPGTDTGSDPAAHALAASVHRTSVVPTPLFGDATLPDVSALGALAGSRTAHPLPAWEGAGTDLMRLTHRPLVWPDTPNRPRLAGTAPGRSADPHAAPADPAASRGAPASRGVPADPADHVGSVLRGFRIGYRTIVAHSTELTGRTGVLSTFAEEAVRLVLRPSQAYAQMLAEATEPRFLGVLAAREAAFDALWDDTGHGHLRVLAEDESADLMAGDIPVFATTPAGRTVLTARGRELPALLDESGLSAVHAKIGRMGAADLRRQEWLIRAALATKAPAPAHRARAPRERASAPTGPAPDAERLLALAVGIGDELAAGACRDDAGRANWPGLQELGQGPAADGQWSVLPMGMSLADGYCGTALFLAELGRVSGIGRYRELAAQAVRPLPGMLRLLADHPELAAIVGPGGFSGLGGVAYATARLAGLLDGATELTAALPDALTALRAAAAGPSVSAGVADGLAGGLLAADAVHTQTGLPEAARLAGELAGLAAGASRPVTAGFLWGRDGVAWALGEERTQDRTRAEPPPGADIGWCSGLAGRAPGGGSSLDHYLARSAERPPLRDLSLCHGELGVLEPLVELYDAEAADLRGRAAARLVRSFGRHGARCGTPLGVPTPGLLTGLAGIGYGLLRLGFGPQIPSVLLLRPSGGSAEARRTTERAPSPWTATS